MLSNLAVKGISYKLLGDTISIRVLASKAVFRMYWRSSSEYLAIKNTMKSAVESLELRAKLREKDLFNSSISLSIEEKAQDIKAIDNIIKDVIEAWSLQGYLRSQI